MSVTEGDELRALLTAPVQEERKAQDRSGFRVYWRNGIRFDTPHPDFRFALGGRIYNDRAFFRSGDNVRAAFGDPEDGTESRTARLYVSGQICENMEFKGEYNVARGDADFKDVGMAVTDVPILGTVKAGHFKEPFGLKDLTSSRCTTFMERGLPNLFAPGRDTGAGFASTCIDDRVTPTAGIFHDADDFGDGFGSGHQVTGRVTGLPLYADDGEQLVHTGVSYSHVATDTLEFESLPESCLAEKLLSTGEFAAADADLVTREGACVFGPFSLQTEYMAVFANPTFAGFYVYGSYFLTGEHRVYKRSSGAFDRVSPKANVGGGAGGPGPGNWPSGTPTSTSSATARMAER